MDNTASEVQAGVRFAISDEGYSLLLNAAREAAGLPDYAPLMPSNGVCFIVRVESPDFLEEPILVPGVILPQSMVSGSEPNA